MAKEEQVQESKVGDLMDRLEQSLHRAKADLGNIASEDWLRERFPEKDWHRHPRTDGRSDLCDGTPSDCAEKVRF